jgi:hypothetical protein
MSRIYLAWLDATTKLIPKTLLPKLVASDVGAIASSARGVSNGVAPLDENGRIPTANLPTGGYVTTAVFNEQIAALQAQIAGGGNGGGTKTAPSALTNVTVAMNTSSGGTEYVVTWYPPTSPGSSALASAVVTYSINGAATVTEIVGQGSTGSMFYYVPRTPAGQVIRFGVAARNADGMTGPKMGFAVTSGTTATATQGGDQGTVTGGGTGTTVNRPSVVTNAFFLPNIGTSTPGQPMAYELTWSPPTSNGGGAITGYTIVYTINGVSTTYNWGSVGPYSFQTATLPVGTKISVSIVANNSAGSSPAMGSSTTSGTLPVPGVTLGGGSTDTGTTTPPMAVSNAVVAPISGSTAGGSNAYRLTWAKPTGGTPSSYVTQLQVDGTVVETKTWGANDTLSNTFPVVGAGKVVRIAVQPYYTANGNTTSGPIMGVAFFSGTLTPPAMTLDGNLLTPAGSATGNDQYGDTYGSTF